MDAIAATDLHPGDAHAPLGLRAAWHSVLPACDGAPLPVQVLAFDGARFTPELFAAWGIVSPQSVARSVRKRQAEYFFGRLAARRALAHAGLSAAQAQADIGIGAAREPRWPAGVIGSISHTRGLAAAVALVPGPRRGVGIDLEQVVDEAAGAALLGTVVDAAELALVHSLAGAYTANALLTMVFSAKESLFKGAFAAVGRYFDFSAARLVALDTDRGHLRLRLTEHLCPQFAHGQECEIGVDLVGADTVITHFVW
ncbi:MAG: 4'-phosphopantetheinyl transferase family protein [Luteimonas sp.]